MSAKFVIIPLTFAATLFSRLKAEKLLPRDFESNLKVINVIEDELDKLQEDQKHCSWNEKQTNGE